MIGLSESELLAKIDEVAANPSDYSAKNIQNQGGLQPRDILTRLASGVAKAIAANNKAIEDQLRSK
jgi:hypothetical protein